MKITETLFPKQNPQKDSETQLKTRMKYLTLSAVAISFIVVAAYLSAPYTTQQEVLHRNSAGQELNLQHQASNGKFPRPSFDDVTTNIHNLAQVHTSNLVILQGTQKNSEEQKKAIDAQAAEDEKSINAKTDEAIKIINAKAVEAIKAINANAVEDIKTKNARAVVDIKAIYDKAAARKKEIDGREANVLPKSLQQLLMQEPKGISRFTPTEYAVNKFYQVGALNYQKLVDDNIIEEPTEPVTLKLNFTDGTLQKYFQFGQVNSDGQLHGFARSISYYGSVYEEGYRNGKPYGFTRTFQSEKDSDWGDYTIRCLPYNWRKQFGGSEDYLIGQNTPKNKVYGLMSDKCKEMFAKMKKNGPENYFIKQ